MDSMPPINYEAAMFWLAVVQFGGYVIVAAYLRVLAVNARTDKKHDEHERAVDRRLDLIEQEVAKIAATIPHLHSDESFRRVYDQLGALSGQVSKMEGQQDIIRALTGELNSIFLRLAEAGAGGTK